MVEGPTTALASPGRILVVDDVPGNRAILERLLTALNFVVESAGDGESALAAALRRAQEQGKR